MRKRAGRTEAAGRTALVAAGAASLLAGCATLEDQPVHARESLYVNSVQHAARHSLSPTEIIWVNPPRATEADRDRRAGAPAR
jgi:hypothetical protein